MKKFIYGLLALVVLSVVANFVFPTINSGKELTKILGAETFNQKDEEYVVYFYQDSCYYCQQLDPTIVEAVQSGIKMYAVDMKAEENMDYWYDWDAHHEKYDVEIGEVVDGKQVLYDGVSKTDYQSEEWKIEEVDGKVVAVHNDAYANFSPTSAQEIQIAGTPVLIHIKDGNLVKMTGGYSESEAYLSGLVAEHQ